MRSNLDHGGERGRERVKSTVLRFDVDVRMEEMEGKRRMGKAEE